MTIKVTKRLNISDPIISHNDPVTLPSVTDERWKSLATNSAR